MGISSEALRLKPVTLIAGGLAVLLLGVGLGHWLGRSGSADSGTAVDPPSANPVAEAPLTSMSPGGSSGKSDASIGRLLENPVPKLRGASLFERARQLAGEDPVAAIAAKQKRRINRYSTSSETEPMNPNSSESVVKMKSVCFSGRKFRRD